MGLYKPKYPEMELGVWCTSNATQNGIRHAAEGDIVTVRRPHHVISDIEAKICLWIRVIGWEEALIWHLSDRLYSESVADPMANLEDANPLPSEIEKRRYCIPLANLAQILDGFSVARALDRLDDYQPEIRSNRVATNFRYYSLLPGPIELDGLVFDKLTQRYLYG